MDPGTSKVERHVETDMQATRPWNLSTGFRFLTNIQNCYNFKFNIDVNNLFINLVETALYVLVTLFTRLDVYSILHKNLSCIKSY